MKKSTKISSYFYRHQKAAIIATFLFVLFTFLGFLISFLFLNSLSHEQVVLFSSEVADGTALNAELTVFIFMIIFGTLVAVSLIVSVVWLLILKFKRKDKVKIPLSSQELNSSETVVDLEVQDE